MVFTLVITNEGNADAEDVVVTDVIPAFLTINSVVVAPAGPTVAIAGNTITIDFGTVTPTVGACPPPSGTSCYVVTITTVVNSSATPPGGTNNATLTTSSQDSDPANNADDAPIAIVVPGVEVPDTGFPPDRLTILPPQPIEDSYLDYGDLRLEIPTLGVTADIVGIPQTGAGWDVSWLGRQAGYLNGTAFPTWLGNSVITAHVSLPSGEPGPFVDLKSLRFGDRVVVQAWGLRHVYEIREVDLVSPADRDVFRHEERSWLTLVTCHGFDEREAAYRWRIVARAVLISIEADDSAEGSISLQMDTLTATPRPPGLPGGR